MVIRYIILKPSKAAELVHLMDEDANTKIELRRKLKEDSEVWEKVRDAFRRSEMIRWKIRDIISMGLSQGLSRNPLRSLDDDEISDSLHFFIGPPHFGTPHLQECYDPDISEITWLNENGMPASPHDDWAYVNAFDLDGDVNPELFVLLRDPMDKIDPVIHAAGRHDLTQVLTGHSVVGSGDYWLEMGATGRDDEWRVFRHKKDPNKEWKYELIEDDEGNKLIFHTYNERNLGEKKDLREEKACVDGD